MKFTLALLTLLMVAVAVVAQEPPPTEPIAVLDFEVAGGSQVEGTALGNQLQAEIFSTRRYKLIDRAAVDRVLAQQAFQQQICNTVECAVQVGKFLQIGKIVLGRVVKVSSTLWQVQVVLVDVQTTESLKIVNLNHEGDYQQLLFKGMRDLALQLTAAEPLPPKPPPPPVRSPVRYGRLFVSSQPKDGEILLDGKPTGQRTDAQLIKVSAGSYVITVDREHLTAQTEVTVVADDVTRVNLKLSAAPAVAYVASAPFNAVVTLDGQEIGRTPLRIDSTAGPHILEFSLDKHRPLRLDIELRRDEVNEITPELIPYTQAELAETELKRQEELKRQRALAAEEQKRREAAEAAERSRQAEFERQRRMAEEARRKWEAETQAANREKQRKIEERQQRWREGPTVALLVASGPMWEIEYKFASGGVASIGLDSKEGDDERENLYGTIICNYSTQDTWYNLKGLIGWSGSSNTSTFLGVAHVSRSISFAGNCTAAIRKSVEDENESFFFPLVGIRVQAESGFILEFGARAGGLSIGWWF